MGVGGGGGGHVRSLERRGGQCAPPPGTHLPPATHPLPALPLTRTEQQHAPQPIDLLLVPKRTHTPSPPSFDFRFWARES